MMGNPPSLSSFERLQVWLESVIMTRLVPTNNPGPVFRFIFRVPILLYKSGLGAFVGPHFLLLTTEGRKTGKPHATPLEFSEDKNKDGYTISAGWGGNTDWYKNALANPQVTVQIGRNKFRAEAIPVPAVEVAKQMQEITRRAPRMARVWQRWSDKPVDGSLESYIYAAKFFPSLRLVPLKNDDRPGLE